MTYDPEKYAQNRERYAEYDRRYREKNPEKVKLRHKIYRQKNLDRHADYERKRRAAKRKTKTDNYTTRMLIESYGSTCHICGQEIDLSAERRTGRPGWEGGLHIDHVVPLSRGGCDTIDNVRPSHGLCNSKKNRYSIS